MDEQVQVASGSFAGHSWGLKLSAAWLVPAATVALLALLLLVRGRRSRRRGHGRRAQR